MNPISLDYSFTIKSMNGISIHPEKEYDVKLDFYRFQVNQKVRVISFDYFGVSDEAPFLVLCLGEVEYFSLKNFLLFNFFNACFSFRIYIPSIFIR